MTTRVTLSVTVGFVLGLAIVFQGNVLIAGGLPLRFGLIKIARDTESVAGDETLFVEYFKFVLNQSEIDATVKLYPPSRLIKLFSEGEIDATFLTEQVGETLAEVSIKGQPLLSTEIALYQNLNFTNEINSPDRELVNKEILIPKESKEIIARLVPQDNVFLEVVKPENIAIMFAQNRATYMIDFTGRADYNLQSVRLDNFRYKKIVLEKVYLTVFMRKSYPDAERILRKIGENFYALRNSPQAESLYDKYGVQLNFIHNSDYQ